MKNTPATLFLFAGIAVTAGNMCGTEAWGNRVPAGLACFAVAIVLGLIAVARSTPVPAETAPSPCPRRAWLILFAFILLHMVVALVICRWIPANDIDTFTVQQAAAQDLIHGIDPYGRTRTDIYDSERSAVFYGPGMVVNGRVQVGLPYPPLTALWILPGYLLGDIRVSYVLAVVLAAVLIFAAGRTARDLWLAVFLLVNPMTFYIEDRCFTEPLVLLLFSATIFTAERRRTWLPLALGLFLASKQYNVLALPLLGLLLGDRSWRRWGRPILLSLGIAALTLLPFAIWDLRALWHDLVLTLVAMPFRPDAISFAVRLRFLLKIGPVLVLGFLLWVAVRVRGVALFAAAYGLAMLLFFATSRQAFANYYFLIAQALFAAAALYRSPVVDANERDSIEWGAAS